jgi:hypothetical protein
VRRALSHWRDDSVLRAKSMALFTPQALLADRSFAIVIIKRAPPAGGSAKSLSQ